MKVDKGRREPVKVRGSVGRSQLSRAGGREGGESERQ
jgi:hypothetical protein